MRSRLYLLTVGALMLAGIVSCGGPKPANAPLEKPGDLQHEVLYTTERFRMYKSVGLRPFDSSEAILISVDADEKSETERFAERASDYLEEGFLDEMKDNYYENFGIVKSDEDARNYDLVIEGSFLEFDRGNRAARFWGVGGLTRVQVTGKMTETATGKVVAEFRDFKLGTGNIDSIDLMEENCDQIGSNISDFLEEVY